MKKNMTDILKLFILFNLLVLALMSMPEQASTNKYRTISQHQVKGDIAMAGTNIKANLEARK